MTVDDAGFPLEVTLDAASAEAEEATETALRLVRARSLGEGDYERELESTVRALFAGVRTATGEDAAELARRVVTLLEAFAALAATSITYAGGKLEIDPAELLAAVGVTVQDARRRAR